MSTFETRIALTPPLFKRDGDVMACGRCFALEWLAFESAGQMITCDRCKTENLDGSQYCDECGAPLRPNGRPSSRNTMYGQQPGQNGSHAQSPNAHPELAGGSGRVSAGLSFSSIHSATKAHARLVIERGRSSGKQFMLSEVEAQIGRWDADGGIFPDVDLDTDDPEAKVSRRHARI